MVMVVSRRCFLNPHLTKCPADTADSLVDTAAAACRCLIPLVAECPVDTEYLAVTDRHLVAGLVTAATVSAPMSAAVLAEHPSTMVPAVIRQASCPSITSMTMI